MGAVVDGAEAIELGRAATRAALTRGCSRDAAEDVAQETLARVFIAADRLDPSARLPFAVTTARNLAVDGHRATVRDRRNRHRLLDPAEAPQPEEATIAGERAAALGRALAGLDAADRQVLVAHSDGMSTAELAEREASTPGAIAARLARSRARLRLDYVLALRKARLPFPACRPVLLAISASDTRRQRALATADHLAQCPTCAELVPPLAQRRSTLAGIATVPLVMLGAVGGKIARLSQQPAAQASAAVGVVGAVGTAAVIGAGGSHHAAPRPVAAPPPVAASPAPPAPPASPAPVRTAAWLRGSNGATLSLADVSRLSGQRIVARRAPVQSVVAHLGFWIGTPGNRIYVHITSQQGLGSPIRKGSTVSFKGVLAPHRPGFAASDGVQGAEGRQELDVMGVHINAAGSVLRRP